MERLILPRPWGGLEPVWESDDKPIPNTPRSSAVRIAALIISRHGELLLLDVSGNNTGSFRASVSLQTTREFFRIQRLLVSPLSSRKRRDTLPRLAIAANPCPASHPSTSSCRIIGGNPLTVANNPEGCIRSAPAADGLRRHGCCVAKDGNWPEDRHFGYSRLSETALGGPTMEMQSIRAMSGVARPTARGEGTALRLGMTLFRAC